jgi:hypothetical protein
MTWNNRGWGESAREYRQQQARTVGTEPGAQRTPKEDRGRRNQADVLLELAQQATLFHVPDGTGYANIVVSGHRETWPIRSRGFRRWLAHLFFKAEHKAIRAEAMQSAIGVIEARAQFDAPEFEVFMRVAEHEGSIYLDLADKDWRAIEISVTGWRVMANPPVRFRRAKGMLPLPEPVGGGKLDRAISTRIDALQKSLNVKTETEFVLVVSYILAAIRGRGPYPVLVLSGEQGSAKSTLSRILRELFDPNTAPLRTPPRSERDLAIAANNSHAQVFENISRLPDWLSDAICRLSTGGGFATRELYTDDDESLFNGCRRVILNGIEDVVTRPDLAERAVVLTLEAISGERRRAEQELWAEFERERPCILGALLDTLVHGLQRLPHVHLDRLPRMADFALWATACETALWPKGAFMAAYHANIAQMVDITLEASPVAMAVRDFMVARTEWEGISQELLAKLTAAVGEQIANSKGWPTTPRALSGQLRRDAPVLRRIGIKIVWGGEGRQRRAIRITSAENTRTQPSPPSPPSRASNLTNLGVTVADPQQTPTVTPTATPSQLKSNDGDGGAGRAGDYHLFSDNTVADDDGRVPDFEDLIR